MNPILFVHGIVGDAKQYQPIIKYLRKKGINNFYEFSYESRIGIHPIKVIAEELADYIKENVKEENINIIAFSQGGIIALAYLKFFKNKDIDKIFTICSPHKGSALAYLLNLPGFIDLRPNSKLLKELEDFTQGNKINIYSLYTPLDLVVLPGWNAKPKHGQTKMVLAPTHTSAFSWPSTMDFIYKNLI
ncbi:MAG: hypothetical protein NT094_02870 [Candidatus Staskawiczbacteria bacterium]|nr:hypothetical protein [Candidatus Staskawiczbacteria bacterium]